jgi:hypothetical protein
MTMGASFCPNCGISAQPGGHFCASCGQLLATTPTATHPIPENSPPSPPPSQWAAVASTIATTAASEDQRRWAILAAVGGVVVCIGSVLPWASFTAGLVGTVDLAGTQGDGILTLAGGVLIALFGFGAYATGRRGLAIGSMIVGVLCLLGALWTLTSLPERLETLEGVSAQIGIGLWVLAAGALVAIVGSIMAARGFNQAKVGAVGSQFAMPDWRGDLRTFPHEVRTNRWWWISALLLITTPVAYVLALNTNEDAAGPFSLYVRLMVSPPAIPILVAGFMSRRAPYLIGFILGILDGILIAAFQVASLEPGTPVANDYFLIGSVSVLSAAVLGAGFGSLMFVLRARLKWPTATELERH